MAEVDEVEVFVRLKRRPRLVRLWRSLACARHLRTISPVTPLTAHVIALSTAVHPAPWLESRLNDLAAWLEGRRLRALRSSNA